MEFLSLSDRIRVIPVIHGSGDCAVEVRRRLLEQPYDCLAVPLPESFAAVRNAVEALPTLGMVVQREQPAWEAGDDDATATYVPIEPCQPVIAAIRSAVQERRSIAFVDAESDDFDPVASVLPDPYALKRLSLDMFTAALLPVIPPAATRQHLHRCQTMAARLRELERDKKNIVFVCGLNEWPSVVDAYLSQTEPDASNEEEGPIDEPSWYNVSRDSVLFLTEELPFIVSRYEQARVELDDDEKLSIDGLKDLLIATRGRYTDELGANAQPPSPQLFSTFLKYVRNLTLVERRLAPDLYTLVTAARQIMGDTFALSLIEISRSYAFFDSDRDDVKMGIDRCELPDGDVLLLKNRLPGPPKNWRSCELTPRPNRQQQQSWQMRWNPFRQCSWPPEDTSIERFRTHVKDHALSLLGNDLARSEKFTTSLKDGLDIRETLRNWHTGDLYVKELPPTVGSLDCVVMLFDAPADPRNYPYRITWHAEHHDESTLGFFATDPQDDVVGPGIARAQYGGALFLFPPREIPEIWRDPRLDFTDTLEERLIAAGCLHSGEKHVALLAAGPPGPGWKRLAKSLNRKLVHVPLSRFSQLGVEQLRSFHVLNGQEVRSYAADFIRKA